MPKEWIMKNESRGSEEWQYSVTQDKEVSVKEATLKNREELTNQTEEEHSE